MSDLWTIISRTWDVLSPPLRPHQDVVRSIEREIDTANSDMLLLGVTPEFARWGKDMTAVDAMPNMIGALWIGDDETRRAVVGDWTALPLEDNSCDAAVGDGSLSALPNHAVRDKVLGEVARVLRPGGRAVIRLFSRRDVTEPLETIRSDVMAGRMPTVSDLVMRLAYALVPHDRDATLKMSVILEAIDAMFPDRDELLAATGWDRNVFSLIETYRGSETVCTWLDEKNALEEAARHFGEVKLASSGGYSQAECCPLLVVAKPLK